jgi:hypothetical protein
MENQTRIIDGTLYARSARPYAHDIRIHDLGHGHLEAVILPAHAWHEVGPLSPLAASDYAAQLASAEPLTEQEKLERLTANRDKVSRRARTKVRRLSLVKYLDCMLTLTYRENMLDRDRCKHDLDLFLKRLRRVFPTFQYIAVLERQKRGAWHVHIACHRVASHQWRKGVLVKSYDLLRSLWRGVVGDDNGNCHQSKSRSMRSPGKLAMYLAKYIGKDLGSDLRKWENSYSASGRKLPPPVVVRVLQSELNAACNESLDLIQPEMAAGCTFHGAYLDGGGYFVAISPPS